MPVYLTVAISILLTAVSIGTAAEPHVRTTLWLDRDVPASGYQSIEAAVAAVANRTNPDSIKHNREHVGGVLRCAAGGYFYTHGYGEPSVATIQFSIPVEKGCTLVALWHTHGDRGKFKKYFSPADTQTAERIGLPFYLASYTGELRVFRPGDKLFARKKVLGSISQLLPRGAARGTLVRDDIGSVIQIATR